jgi:hypothetical protein
MRPNVDYAWVDVTIPTHPLPHTFSSLSTVQSHSNNCYHHSSHLRRYYHPHTQSSLHTPIISTHEQFDGSPWHISSASKYSSPRLCPLISKFEALDADSLTFNIRDAQPPHLRLHGSRSRSRSARSISEPAKERCETSRVSGHMKPNLRVNISIEKRTDAAKGTNQQPKTASFVDLEPNINQQQLGNGRVKDIWIDGSEDGLPQKVVIADTVVALAEPKPVILAETLRMIRLYRWFGERSGTWRRNTGRSSEKGGLAA